MVGDKLDWITALPLRYLYLGTVIPVGLLTIRQALDFAYRDRTGDEFSCGLYFCLLKMRREENVTSRKSEPVPLVGRAQSGPDFTEEMVEKITAKIRILVI